MVRIGTWMRTGVYGEPKAGPGRRRASRARRKTLPALPAATVCFARPAVSCIAADRLMGGPEARSAGRKERLLGGSHTHLSLALEQQL